MNAPWLTVIRTRAVLFDKEKDRFKAPKMEKVVGGEDGIKAERDTCGRANTETRAEIETQHYSY